MSDESMMEVNNQEFTEKLEHLITLARDYERHVGGKFVFKYRLPNLSEADWSKRQQTYCYEFRLPDSVKLSLVTNYDDVLKCDMWYNYRRVASPEIVDRTVDIVTKYLTDRVDDSLNKVLDSITDTFNKDVKMRKSYR